MPCAGNSSEACGGGENEGALNVYFNTTSGTCPSPGSGSGSGSGGNGTSTGGGSGSGSGGGGGSGGGSGGGWVSAGCVAYVDSHFLFCYILTLAVQSIYTEIHLGKSFT